MLYGADCWAVEKGIPKISMMTIGKFVDDWQEKKDGIRCNCQLFEELKVLLMELSLGKSSLFC
jgi:hypothetical protein